MNDMYRDCAKNSCNYWTTVAMKVYGGDFVKKLAELIAIANEESLDKLQKAFPAHFAKYVVLGQQIKNQIPDPKEF